MAVFKYKVATQFIANLVPSDFEFSIINRYPTPNGNMIDVHYKLFAKFGGVLETDDILIIQGVRTMPEILLGALTTGNIQDVNGALGTLEWGGILEGFNLQIEEYESITNQTTE